MNSWIRIGLALVLSFLLSLSVALINGQDLLTALQAGLVIALLSGEIVAVLSWGMEMAVANGYPGWLGFLLALCLNILGLIVLALLPARTQPSHKPVDKQA